MVNVGLETEADHDRLGEGLSAAGDGPGAEEGLERGKQLVDSKRVRKWTLLREDFNAVPGPVSLTGAAAAVIARRSSEQGAVGTEEQRGNGGDGGFNVS